MSEKPAVVWYSDLTAEQIKEVYRGWIAEGKLSRSRPMRCRRERYYLTMPDGMRKMFPIIPGKTSLFEEVLAEARGSKETAETFEVVPSV